MVAMTPEQIAAWQKGHTSGGGGGGGGSPPPPVIYTAPGVPPSTLTEIPTSNPFYVTAVNAWNRMNAPSPPPPPAAGSAALTPEQIAGGASDANANRDALTRLMNKAIADAGSWAFRNHQLYGQAQRNWQASNPGYIGSSGFGGGALYGANSR